MIDVRGHQNIDLLLVLPEIQYLMSHCEIRKLIEMDLGPHPAGFFLWGRQSGDYDPQGYGLLIFPEHNTVIIHSNDRKVHLQINEYIFYLDGIARPKIHFPFVILLKNCLWDRNSSSFDSCEKYKLHQF